MFRNPISKKTFILIHGAWHANWCWKKVITLLEAEGHVVFAPNLPGHDGKEISFEGVTLETYTSFFEKFIMENCKGKVVLVAHSAGGVTASQLAECMSDRIEQIIYVSAYVPENGKSLLDETKQSQPSSLRKGFVFDRPNNSVALMKIKEVEEAFYDNCRKDDAAFAMDLLQKEPIAPMANSIKISKEKFGKIPKVYISCTQDKALHPQDQARIYARLNANIVPLDSDHSPFLSTPDLLVKVILKNTLTSTKSLLRVGFFISTAVLAGIVGYKVLPALLETPKSKL